MIRRLINNSLNLSLLAHPGFQGGGFVGVFSGINSASEMDHLD
jgi:hypothetical protein